MFKTIAILAATMTAALASNSYELATHGSFDATDMPAANSDPCELTTMTEVGKQACRDAREAHDVTAVKGEIVKALSDAGMTMNDLLASNMNPCELKTLSEADKQFCLKFEMHHKSNGATTLLQEKTTTSNLRKNSVAVGACFAGWRCCNGACCCWIV